MDGRELRYYGTGEKMQVASWRKGVLDGRFERFYLNGRRELSTGYKKGVESGKYMEGSEDGQWVLKGGHKKGLMDGALKLKVGGKTVSTQKWKAGVPVDIDGVVPFSREKEALLDELAKALTPPKGVDGANRTEMRMAALRRLQAYRALCGLPYKEMRLEKRWNELCDAAAEVCRRLGGISHTPDRPKDTSDELYKDGQLGAKNSNLASGGGMVRSVDMYMDDSDQSNIDRVGHRRWCLNPAMKVTGFGEAGGYSAMWSMDGSGKGSRDLKAVMYPPPGYVPVEMFGGPYAWSLAPLGKALPKEDEITIEIQPLGRFYLPEGEPLQIDFKHVDKGGYGAGPCLIFRPAGLRVEQGASYRCRVSFDGGKSAAFEYIVEFVSDERLKTRTR